MNALAALLTLAVVVSSLLLIVRLLAAKGRRPAPGPSPAVHDLYEAAFLGGGPGRVVDTALTALHADGRLLIGGPGIVSVQRPQAHDPVERAVLQELGAAPSGALAALRDAVMRHPAVQEIGDGLAARGLLVPPADTRPLRRWGVVQGVCCLIAFPVSLGLTFVQYAMVDGLSDMPLPFIVKVVPAILLGAISGLVVAVSSAKRITRAGRRAAEGFRAAHASVESPARLVAVRGPRALPDPGLQGHLVAAARLRGPGDRSGPIAAGSSAAGTAAVAATVWCASTSPGHTSCGGSTGGGSGSGCGGGSGCGAGSGSGCGGGGSSCGGGGGSSCGGGGGSSCGGGGS
ncbi:TIGR04222 domain-containing membrane protein [Streptomyces sp. ADI96-02]|uniref:TIGR04222 domain-containing membrane protein n=1 Tax=Streptomyces sp. ADI96-02 TaxID=1522760 RepID=UPI0019D0F3C2|nr:TIGR04222 domain-containing membrane protein [Streptomyces sp. ADI96-02]